jgi:hypothetical protein
MLRSELQDVIMKFVGASAAMSMLASCAIAVPLRPLTLHGRGEGELTCMTDSRCSNGNRDRQAAHRHSRPVVNGKIDDDPPDFILNNTNEERIVR